ncbi:MAG: LPXTG cell wall anchor domain-containing protein, partial [Cellulosilyticaceae bacterium]
NSKDKDQVPKTGESRAVDGLLGAGLLFSVGAVTVVSKRKKED